MMASPFDGSKSVGQVQGLGGPMQQEGGDQVRALSVPVQYQIPLLGT